MRQHRCVQRLSGQVKQMGGETCYGQLTCVYTGTLVNVELHDKTRNLMANNAEYVCAPRHTYEGGEQFSIRSTIVISPRIDRWLPWSNVVVVFLFSIKIELTRSTALQKVACPDDHCFVTGRNTSLDPRQTKQK